MTDRDQGRPQSLRTPWLTRAQAVAARPVVWVCLTAVVVVLDYVAGPHVQLAVLYLVPLALASWYGPLRLAFVVALLPPALRLSYFVLDVWEPPGQLIHVTLNALVRIAVLAAVAVLLHRARRARELEREVATLRGLLPICMYCKRVEDSEGRWHSVEQYVAARSDAAFTHRVCPLCTDTHRHVFLGGGGPDRGGRASG
jgi:hypothetical protein